MGKPIIKPLPYQINNNNNLGTLNVISDPNYEGVDIDTFEVRDKLQEASPYELLDLCTSPNINKFAAFKPNGRVALDPPYSYHGLYPESKVGNTTMPFDWVYEPPNGNIAVGYRLEDFIGYNHNASIPGFTDVESGSVGILERWPVGTNNFLWSSQGVEHTITLVIALPEWDIRGFPDGNGRSVTHYAVTKYLKDGGSYILEPEAKQVVELTDAMISARTVNAEYKFTPTMSTDWTGVIPGNELSTPTEDTKSYAREFKTEAYLGNIAMGAPSPEYYANFPSENGGTVELIGTIQWEHFYAWGAATLEPCLGGGIFGKDTGKDPHAAYTANRLLRFDRKDDSLIAETEWWIYDTASGVWAKLRSVGSPHADIEIWRFLASARFGAPSDTGTWSFTTAGLRNSEVQC